jgi:predicted nicotinamide N-methyase
VTGARVWDAAVVLAKLVEHQASKALGLGPNTPVVELGAGCGLSGMATALLGAPTV